VVYELLVRDFDGRNYQSIIDRIDYFKNLKINAIELLPVMVKVMKVGGIILPFIWL
jgi:1,4-alpha-glucan branching enzyme